MATLWRWLRSFLFVVQMFVVMALMGLVYLPLAVADRRYASRGVHTYCRWVRWSAAVMVGLRSEVRGDIPQGEVLIASKHQSFFDIIILCSVLPQPKFIMKKQLVHTPVLGWYAKRIGCVAVDRGKGGAAVHAMLAEVKSGDAPAGQLIIYPQGTRTAPGAKLRYKIGSGALYADLGQTCIPAATNVGLFWPRKGIYRKPGLAVVEFLAPIEPGLDLPVFMATLEERVETASNALMSAAGFHIDT